MKILKTFRGGSLSKTLLVDNGDRVFVRKFVSASNNREYGLVRWQSQLRRLQLLRHQFPKNTLPILGSGVLDNDYYYDIPYISGSKTLLEALNSDIDVYSLSEQLCNLVLNLANSKLDPIPGAFSLYIAEEILRPMLLARDEVEKFWPHFRSDEQEHITYKIQSAVKKVRSKMCYYDERIICESFTHGNLTLENMLWDDENNNIILIDPYGETYCDSILGDISQVLQSAKSGYEIIVQHSDSMQLSMFDYPEYLIPEKFLIFSDLFIEKLRPQNWFDEHVIKIYHASQFSRMFPFRLNKNPRLAYLFMLRACSLIEDL